MQAGGGVLGLGLWRRGWCGSNPDVDFVKAVAAPPCGRQEPKVDCHVLVGW